MKNILLILALILVSCSNSDDSEDCFLYEARIESECANFDTRITYIITKSEHDYLKNQMDGVNPCIYVTFETKSGDTISGYLRSVGKISC